MSDPIYNISLEYLEHRIRGVYLDRLYNKEVGIQISINMPTENKLEIIITLNPKSND